MKKEPTVKKQRRSPLELMAAMAIAFRPTSVRSGAMVGGSYTPTAHGMTYFGPSSIRGRIKHAGEVRRNRRHQRCRARLKAMRRRR